MSTIIPHTPFRVPDILLPKPEIDLGLWSIIACDQFTSAPAYWKKVEQLVGNKPSTLSLILPEVYLECDDLALRLAKIKENARLLEDSHMLNIHKDCLLLLDRSSPRVPNRKGIALQIDLSQYDPDPTVGTPIRASEAIVASRLPKRIEVRKQSKYDLSHVLMLYEDSAHLLYKKLFTLVENTAYSTELMLDGGSIKGECCNTPQAIQEISNFFMQQQAKTNSDIMAIVGDGNHSLMSAKQVWLDSGADLESPERWALVELINIFDEGLEVEPIHRVLFNAQTDKVLSILSEHGKIKAQKFEHYSAKIILEQQVYYWKEKNTHKLAIETIEEKLISNTDLYEKIDFIHSESEVLNHASLTNNIGIIFSEFSRHSIFDTIRKHKLFPRKSFSLGQEKDKKYYTELTRRD